MATIDGFSGEFRYPDQKLVTRRNTVVARIKENRPDDLEALLEDSPTDEVAVKLPWVSIPDPRDTSDNPSPMLVQPEVYFGSAGYCGIWLATRLPEGEEKFLGSMSVLVGYDPLLVVSFDDEDQKTIEWNTVDAEHFLRMLESVFQSGSTER